MIIIKNKNYHGENHGFVWLIHSPYQIFMISIKMSLITAQYFWKSAYPFKELPS